MSTETMDLEKLGRRIDAILREISDRGFDLREEFLEVLEANPEIKELILETKLKKINYFADEENKKFVGLNIGEYNISFDFEYGEDEEGPYYDVEAFIVKA